MVYSLFLLYSFLHHYPAYYHQRCSVFNNVNLATASLIAGDIIICWIDGGVEEPSVKDLIKYLLAPR